MIDPSYERCMFSLKVRLRLGLIFLLELRCRFAVINNGKNNKKICALVVKLIDKPIRNHDVVATSFINLKFYNV